jgi:hypothetical protein
MEFSSLNLVEESVIWVLQDSKRHVCGNIVSFDWSAQTLSKDVRVWIYTNAWLNNTKQAHLSVT